ncbi:hypothetical protein KUV57_12585 [Epibacterium sp. DP7N7-1]|nr:hypothetical protein [Epibacterium sp. DP7N7-1]
MIRIASACYVNVSSGGTYDGALRMVRNRHGNEAALVADDDQICLFLKF